MWTNLSNNAEAYLNAGAKILTFVYLLRRIHAKICSWTLQEEAYKWLDARRLSKTLEIQ